MDYVPLENFAVYFPRFLDAYEVTDPTGERRNLVGHVLNDKNFSHQSTWLTTPQLTTGEQPMEGSKKYQSVFLARRDDTVAILHVEYKLN